MCAAAQRIALKLRRAEEKVVIQYSTRAARFKRLLGGRLGSGAGELTIDVPVPVLANHRLQLVGVHGGSEGPHAALRGLRIRGVENPLLHSIRRKSDDQNGFAFRLERYAEAVFDLAALQRRSDHLPPSYLKDTLTFAR